jgi:hypothetical protein
MINALTKGMKLKKPGQKSFEAVREPSGTVEIADDVERDADVADCTSVDRRRSRAGGFSAPLPSLEARQHLPGRR